LDGSRVNLSGVWRGRLTQTRQLGRVAAMAAPTIHAPCFDPFGAIRSFLGP